MHVQQPLMHAACLALLLLLTSPGTALAHPNKNCPEGRPRCRALTPAEQATLANLVRMAETALPLPPGTSRGKKPHPGTIEHELARRKQEREQGEDVPLSPYGKCLPYASGCFPASSLGSRLALHRLVADGKRIAEFVDPSHDARDLLVDVAVGIDPVDYCPERKGPDHAVREGPQVMVARVHGLKGQPSPWSSGPRPVTPRCSRRARSRRPTSRRSRG